IEERRLSQTEAAKLMGIAQPDVSKLLRGKFDGFSLERLLEFVRALGSDVEIKIKSPARQGREGRMSLMWHSPGTNRPPRAYPFSTRRTTWIGIALKETGSR
ncbi:MAG TPA: helix-turn-helix transcriptional regulator, partial [Xanthobacteraceae bacterium]|nr:helix-turn-helix transcriptional regulator [Xanthobacteraceae bacterium]